MQTSATNAAGMLQMRRQIAVLTEQVKVANSERDKANSERDAAKRELKDKNLELSDAKQITQSLVIGNITCFKLAHELFSEIMYEQSGYSQLELSTDSPIVFQLSTQLGINKAFLLIKEFLKYIMFIFYTLAQSKSENEFNERCIKVVPFIATYIVTNGETTSTAAILLSHYKAGTLNKFYTSLYIGESNPDINIVSATYVHDVITELPIKHIEEVSSACGYISNPRVDDLLLELKDTFIITHNAEPLYSELTIEDQAAKDSIEILYNDVSTIAGKGGIAKDFKTRTMQHKYEKNDNAKRYLLKSDLALSINPHKNGLSYPVCDTKTGFINYFVNPILATSNSSPNVRFGIVLRNNSYDSNLNDFRFVEINMTLTQKEYFGYETLSNRFQDIVNALSEPAENEGSRYPGSRSIDELNIDSNTRFTNRKPYVIRRRYGTKAKAQTLIKKLINHGLTPAAGLFIDVFSYDGQNPALFCKLYKNGRDIGIYPHQISIQLHRQHIYNDNGTLNEIVFRPSSRMEIFEAHTMLSFNDHLLRSCCDMLEPLHINTQMITSDRENFYKVNVFRHRSMFQLGCFVLDPSKVSASEYVAEANTRLSIGSRANIPDLVTAEKAFNPKFTTLDSKESINVRYFDREQTVSLLKALCLGSLDNTIVVENKPEVACGHLAELIRSDDPESRDKLNRLFEELGEKVRTLKSMECLKLLCAYRSRCNYLKDDPNMANLLNCSDISEVCEGIEDDMKVFGIHKEIISYMHTVKVEEVEAHVEDVSEEKSDEEHNNDLHMDEHKEETR